MAKHKPGDPACPDLYYWWDETWSRHRVGRDRALAESRASIDAEKLIADGKQRVKVLEINPESKDGFYAVKYSVRLAYTPQFHTCKCPE